MVMCAVFEIAKFLAQSCFTNKDALSFLDAMTYKDWLVLQ